VRTSSLTPHHLTPRAAFKTSSAAAAASVFALLTFVSPRASLSQQATAPRTLVAVLAYADDEDPAGPMFARYAREGVQVYLLIASDGGQGTGFAAARGDTPPREQDLVRMRTAATAPWLTG
jgi:hypothetical protein